MPVAKKPLFPKAIADQVAYVNAKQSYIISVAPRLSISATRLSELAAEVSKVNAAYAKASDKETRSQLDTTALQIALKDCHETLRRIIDYSVKNNPSSSVQPEDFKALNVYRPGTHEPLPDPTHSPRVASATSSDNIVTLTLVNPLNGKRGKPSG
jgi:predicted GTPase